jgi:hypothetical protein
MSLSQGQSVCFGAPVVSSVVLTVSGWILRAQSMQRVVYE